MADPIESFADSATIVIPFLVAGLIFMVVVFADGLNCNWVKALERTEISAKILTP